MKDYCNERWRETLAHNGLVDFQAIWQFEADWFEPPNRRRGGWSGVSRCELTHPDGTPRVIFLKRQENHGTPTFWHPFRGEPTYAREFRRIMNYRQAAIPALEPVYFAMRRVGGDDRAILITEELSGYSSLEKQVCRWWQDGAPPRAERLRVLLAVAALMRDMHARGLQHSCFYPKHIFTRREADGNISVRVIDLEKSRWRPFKILCALRDLYALHCLSPYWSRSDRLRFLKAYLQVSRLTPYGKWLWRKVAQRAARKRRRIDE